MFRNTIAVIAFTVGAAIAAGADDRPAPPKKSDRVPAFNLVLAQAVERDGKVTIRFSLQVAAPDGADPVGGPQQRPVIGARTKIVWHDFDVPADGKDVRAWSADGKPLSSAALSKKLPKASKAVLFYGHEDPDPFYFGLFRDDVVLFVAPDDKFFLP
jgi:hypothetical protein